jgi:cobalt-zinc-cadmium efflux system membrane fusion protein
VPTNDLQQARAAVREARLRLQAAQQVLANIGLPIDAQALTQVEEREAAERVRVLGLPAPLIPSLDDGDRSFNLVPLRTTIEGVVTQRDVVPGEVVDANRPLFVVTDARRMWLMLDVRAEDAGQVAVGRMVRFRPDAGEEEVTGTVAWIEPHVDEKARTVKVRAHLDNAAGRLRAYLFGQGRIILREEPKAILVPSEAVQDEGCCRIVFVRDKRFLEPEAPKVFHVRTVQVGAEMDGRTELIAGVLPGEAVVTKGAGVLRAELLKNSLGAGCCDHHH